MLKQCVIILVKTKKNALVVIKNWDKNLVRVQDKVLYFILLDNKDYVQNVEDKVNRSSFQAL